MKFLRFFTGKPQNAPLKPLAQPTNPPVIQSLWIGNELSLMEQICILSFIKNGHEFVLYTYEEIENVPEGTIVDDANSIIDRSKIFKYKDHDSYAGFANRFRYKLLYEKGGYWVDTDIFCLKPLSCENDYVFASQRDKKGGQSVNCCLIKAPADSKIMKYCYEKSIKKKPEKLKWGETGPVLLTKAVKKFNMWDSVLPAETFCPIDYWNWAYFIEESAISVLNDSMAVHFWNEMWRRNKIDKSMEYDGNCVYEQLKKKVC